MSEDPTHTVTALQEPTMLTADKMVGKKENLKTAGNKGDPQITIAIATLRKSGKTAATTTAEATISAKMSPP